jgi:hypothetical protein
MPFRNGDIYTWILGNSRFTSRVYNFTSIQPFITTNNSICQCCDYSQSNLNKAKAIVFNCIDFRLRDNVTCHLNLKGYKNDYDEVIAAGASLGYNGLSEYTNWDTFIDEHISIAYDLHEISQILIIEHEKCGAYTVQYGNNITTEEEYQFHIDNAKICADVLWSKFNATDGSVKKINNLKIIAYIISIDGSSFTELYRRE